MLVGGGSQLYTDYCTIRYCKRDLDKWILSVIHGYNSEKKLYMKNRYYWHIVHKTDAKKDLLLANFTFLFLSLDIFLALLTKIESCRN